jgi:lipopolysaccharide biosynthesis glycosyltransferase
MNNVVVYASDNNYIPHLAVSMISVIENNRDIENLKFCILDNEISDLEKEKLREICMNNGRDIQFVNIEEYVINAPLNTTFNKTAFARLFIASILNDDKALYLDCDTIVTKSLKEIFDINMYEYLVAGVQDTVYSKLRMEVGLTYEERYINSGVLLLNLKLWREQLLESKFIHCIKEFDGNVPHNDQGIINAVCHNKCLVLDAKYNVQDAMLMYSNIHIKEIFDIPLYYEDAILENAKKNPTIIHYTEANYGRPWFIDSNHPLKNNYMQYREILKEYWPVPNEKTTTKKRINRLIKQVIYKILPFSLYNKILFYKNSKVPL